MDRGSGREARDLTAATGEGDIVVGACWAFKGFRWNREGLQVDVAVSFQAWGAKEDGRAKAKRSEEVWEEGPKIPTLESNT